MAMNELKAGISDDLLAALNFGEPVDLPQAKLDPVFGIHIGQYGFLVSTKIYCEVLDKTSINPLPNVHPWVNGILNLRGNFVPVFDLHNVLGVPVQDNQKRRLFTIDRGDRAVAIWIDNFPEIIDKSQLKALPTLPQLPHVVQRTTRSGFQNNGQIWLEIKFDDLFATLGRHQYATEE